MSRREKRGHDRYHGQDVLRRLSITAQSRVWGESYVLGDYCCKLGQHSGYLRGRVIPAAHFSDEKKHIDDIPTSIHRISIEMMYAPWRYSLWVVQSALWPQLLL